jgi:hypothetical protein
MRRLALVVALLLGACSAPAAAPQPPAATPATPAVFLSEGGLLRPVPNGGRVSMVDGSVEVSFAPYPPRTTSELSVVVRDAAGRPVAADVVVVYDMIGMEHGAMFARAVASGERQRASIGLPMPGPWKFTLRVTRASEVSSLLFIVPDAP